MVVKPIPLAAAVVWLALAPLPLLAQVPSAPPPAAVPAPPDDDTAVVAAEPDFTLVALPTALRLPDGKWAFRVTHRFTRSLGRGDLGDLASDLFGLDGSALVGLEVRYGLRRGTQVALLRTSDRTIQLLAQQSIVRAGARAVSLDAVAAVQGLDNFSEAYTGTLGVIVARRFGARGAAYLQPLVVMNPLPESETADDFAIVAALGARLRVGASAYLVGEFAPRVAGPSPDQHHAAFALEKRRGGHSFQISVANSFATTLGQIARGYGGSNDWRLGFTISRKFYRPSPSAPTAPAR